jgi:hypothetical protein
MSICHMSLVVLDFLIDSLVHKITPFKINKADLLRFFNNSHRVQGGLGIWSSVLKGVHI